MKIVAALNTSRGNRYSRNHDAALFAGEVVQGDEVRNSAGESDGALFALADGVGAGPCAALASRCALDQVQAMSQARGELVLNRALARTLHEALCERGRRRCHGMATTLAVLSLADGRATWLSIGDSRIYLLREGELQQLTHDHTLRAEWQASVEGNDEDGGAQDLDNSAFDGLASCLIADSAEDGYDVCMGETAVLAGDRWLLCTDGVSGAVRRDVLATLVQASHAPADWCQALMDEALSALDNVDNATVIGLEVVSVLERLAKPL